jgi:Gram-negative bacterial TonB protein C-terminal
MEITTTSRMEEGGYYRWAEPNSEITVYLKTETVDRLQRDALRAVASSPRAQKEVGGILLGRIDANETSIVTFVDDFVPFPCAHENGPSYDLTAAETAGFEATLAQGRTQWKQSVVGYYRSHNRNGLFLSPCDLQLIQHHFRAPDNMFLIIKTLPNRTCTAGFFFWKDGHIQSEFTDSEAPLIPISFPSAVEVASPPEAVVQVRIDQPIAAAIEFTGRGTLRRRLISGIMITGVAAAATVAAIRYRVLQPARSRAALEIPLVAKGTVRARAGMPEPASILPSPNPSKPEDAPAQAVMPERPSPFRPPPTIERPAPARTQSARSREFASKSRSARRPFIMPPSLASNATGRAFSLNPSAPATVEPSASGAGPLLPVNETMCCVASASYELSRPNRLKRLIHEVPGLRKLNPSRADDKGFVAPRPLHEIQIFLPPDTSALLTQKKQVDVRASVDASGRVTRVELLSPRDEYLVKLAAYNASGWRFAPAELNDHPVSSEVILHFSFDADLSHRQ